VGTVRTAEGIEMGLTANDVRQTISRNRDFVACARLAIVMKSVS